MDTTNKSAQPLKSPTEARAVHFPLIDLSNDSNNTPPAYEPPTIVGLPPSTSSSIIKSVRFILLHQFDIFSLLLLLQSSSAKSIEKRASTTISAIRRRLIGHSSSKNRDRNSQDDDHASSEGAANNQQDTSTADEILARYSSKSSNSVENAMKSTMTNDESSVEPMTVSETKEKNNGGQFDLF